MGIHNNDLLKKPSLRCLRGHVCPDNGCPRCRAQGRSRSRAQVLLWWREEWTSPHLLQRIHYPQWTTLQRKRIQLPGIQRIQLPQFPSPRLVTTDSRSSFESRYVSKLDLL